MIVVTRLNGTTFAVNPDLIERVQEAPDTTLFMVDGSTYNVREHVADVIELIQGHRARVLAAAFQMRDADPSVATLLRLDPIVPPGTDRKAR
ncbi:flagellar FlbD family protein [Agromyces humi]|uniref:flagellar FlbD family protein n=1 Tax=Agromyces humi TaxID=1766800 RepID=UPI0013573F9F|nr:flagellar FlbD family protein [Agromyces humi]